LQLAKKPVILQGTYYSKKFKVQLFYNYEYLQQSLGPGAWILPCQKNIQYGISILFYRKQKLNSYTK